MFVHPVQPVPVRTTDRVAEIAWFDDLGGGDTEFLSQLPKYIQTQPV